MKLRLISKATAGVALAGAVFFTGGVANAGVFDQMFSIADSWHNLGSGNSKSGTPNNPSDGQPNRSQDTGEICVFCHTPHGGDVSAAVPIWNRKLNSPDAYVRYSSLNRTTFDAEEGPIGSVTIACLSCHDGAQAIDALINAPGSGAYTPPSTAFGSAAYRDWTNLGMTGSDIAQNKLAPGIVQNLTTDLSDDHPVSMQYGGGGITGANGTVAGDTKDPDFTDTTVRQVNGFPVFLNGESHATLGTVFWIERGSESLDATGRDREDIIFYTRDFTPEFNGTAAGIQPFVECGSCHDPHNVDNPTFLRTSNGIAPGSPLEGQFPNATTDGASGLCLTCHAK